MRKATVLFILAVILFLLGLVEAISGFILWFALPHGGGRWNVEQIFWGLSRDVWAGIHNWVAVALIVLVTVHILFHWKWLVRMFKSCCPNFRRSS